MKTLPKNLELSGQNPDTRGLCQVLLGQWGDALWLRCCRHLVAAHWPQAAPWCSPCPRGRQMQPPKLCVSCPFPSHLPAAFPLLSPSHRHLACFMQAELTAPETQRTSLWECLQGSQSILTKPAAPSSPQKGIGPAHVCGDPNCRAGAAPGYAHPAAGHGAVGSTHRQAQGAVERIQAPLQETHACKHTQVHKAKTTQAHRADINGLCSRDNISNPESMSIQRRGTSICGPERDSKVAAKGNCHTPE